MRISGIRKALGAIGAFALVAGGVSLDVAPASAVSPFPVTDSGKGTPGAIDPTWSYSRSGTNNKYGNTYTSDGWVRLTDAKTTESTNILDDTKFPSSTGFRVTFDYRQAGGTPYAGARGENTGTGDGIAMYLINGDNTISSGAPGSGLGYAAGGTGQAATASQCTTGGVTGGYLGLGLDVFGNYASANFGSYGGATGLTGSEIGLRGSGSGCGTYNSRYPWVTGKSMSLWTGTSGSTADPAGVADSKYRRVTITVVPQGSNVQVTVAMSALAAKNAAAGAMTQVFSANLNGVAGQAALPAYLKLGFSASTGAATDYHDIRNIAVSALTDPSITKTLSTSTQEHDGYPVGTFLPGDPISFTLTAINNGPSVIGDTPDGVARVYDDLSKLPISNVSWTCSPSLGAACANGSGGTGSVVSQDWTGPSGSYVTVTVSGTVTATPGTFTNTAILPTDFTKNVVDPDNPYAQKDMGAVDTDTTNNTATAQFTVVVPHFTQTKSADKAQYVVGDPITYIVTVTNDGKGEGSASLADMVPANVDVSGATCQGAGNATCQVTADGNNVTGSIYAPTGGSATFTITGKVTAEPSVTNTATVTPDVPGCAPADCGGGPAPTPSLPVVSPSLSLKKTALQADGQSATELAIGDEITYQYIIKNTGDTEQDGVGINEVNFTGRDDAGNSVVLTPSCPTADSGWSSGKAGVLAAGQTVTCTATYTVTQNDMDNGHLSNTATAYGTPPGFDTPIVSDPSTADVKATGGPAITVTKRADISGFSVPVKAGDPVVYTVTAVNSGTATLTDFTFTDALKGLPELALTWPDGGDADTLLPGQEVTGTATYILTQADLNSGTVSNTATVTAHDPQGNPLSDDDSALVDLTKTTGYGPALTMTKTADTSKFSNPVKAGDPITYTVTATNSGDVTLTSVTPTDSLPGLPALTLTWPVPTAPGTLQPGQKVTGTAVYTLTQKDLDAGTVANTATGTAKDPKGNTVTGKASTTTDLTAVPDYGGALSVTKTDDMSAIQTTVHVGATINYSITALNTGDVTLSGLSFTDSLPGVAVSCPSSPSAWTSGTVGVLAPDDTITCVASYALTQDDIDAVFVTNTATGTAQDPHGNSVTDQGSVKSDLTPYLGPYFTQSKAADADAYVPGQAITYTITVNNTGSGAGTTDISDTVPATVAVTGASCDATPSDTGTCDVSYDGNNVTGSTDLPVGGTAVVTVTGKVLSGPEVTNTAMVTPTSPVCDQDGADCGGGPAPTPVIPVLNPSLTVQKTATVDGAEPQSLAVGQQIDYSFLVTNTGETPLSDVHVVEGAFTGSGTLSPVSCPTDAADWPSGELGVLDLDQAVTCTASYTVTQKDLDSGTVTNTATADGTPPGVDDPVTSPPDSVEMPANADSGLTVTKTADLKALHPLALVGDPVGYTITAQNTGHVTLHDVTLTDDLAGLTVVSYQWPDESTGATGTLAPGQEVIVKATYPLKQSDFDNGSVTNTATGTAKDPKGNKVEDDTTIHTDLSSHLSAKFSWTKTADRRSYVPGQQITYTLSAGNIGNIAGSDSFNDPVPGTVTVSSVSCSAIPTPSATCNVTNVGNAVSGTVDLPAGGTAVVTINGTVNADAPSGSEVTNTATVSGPCDPSVQTCTAPCDPATQQCTPKTDPIPVLTPALAVVKTADISSLPTPARVGDTVSYTITATNDGEAPLTDVTLSDSLIGAAGLSYRWPDGTVGNTGSLKVGQQVVVTASYALTQKDLDAGAVTNTALASGTDQAGKTVTGEDTITTDITNHLGPQLSVDKTADLTGLQSLVRPGDTIAYNIKVSNTGDVTISNIGVVDQLAGVTAVCPDQAAGWPSGTVGQLAPGQQVNCTASYAVTQDDITATQVVNTAVASGEDPQGNPVDGTGTVTSDLTPYLGPLFGGTKTADQASYVPGQAITYTLTITNDGNAVGSETFSDPVPATVTVGSVSCQASPVDTGACTVSNDGNAVAGSVSLPAGGSAVVTISGTVNSDAADGSSATNTVHIDGVCGPGDSSCVGPCDAADPNCQPPCDPTVQQCDIITPQVPIVTPGLTLVKTGTIEGPSQTVLKAGETVDYQFVVTNTGGTPLSDVGITEGNFTGTGQMSAVSCPAAATDWPSGTVGLLAPDESVTCSASYVLSQADVDWGLVINTATAEGTPPGVDTPVVSPEASAQVPSDPDPSVSVVKTADLSGVQTPAQVGDQIVYTIAVQNIGSVTLSDVSVTDDLAGLTDIAYAWPDGTTDSTGQLAPNATMTVTAKYALTQADLDAGNVVNTAVAAGTPPPTLQDPDPQPIPPTDTTITTDITDHLTSGIVLHKTGKLADGATGVPGDIVNYSFTATNTGDTTLNNVSIADKLAGLSAITYTWPGAAGVLAPGQQVTATATYKLTQADIDAGGVRNQAIATGTPPVCATNCKPPTGGDGVDVPVTSNPGLTMSKTASTSTYTLGTVITYTFTMSNTGNVTLNGVKPVEGAFTGSGALSNITCPSDTVAPGQTLVCTATYTATAADVAAGTLANSATAVGTPPSNDNGPTPGLTTSTPSTVTLTATPILVSTGGVLDGTGGMAWQFGVWGVGLMLGLGLAGGVLGRRFAKNS